MAGYWEFPGGKQESGETIQSCLERELMEEFSIESRAGEIVDESVYEYEEGVIKLIGIRTEILDKTFVLSVHDKVEWVPIPRILTYQLAPADIPLAKKLTESYA